MSQPWLVEGDGPEPDIPELYRQFQELREQEGPGAGDEGEILRLELEMSDAAARNDAKAFLDTMSKALLAMQGLSSGQITDLLQ